jgi:Protein of unknown function (DUF3990)
MKGRAQLLLQSYHDEAASSTMLGQDKHTMQPTTAQSLMDVGLCQQAVLAFLTSRDCVDVSRYDVMHMVKAMIEDNWNRLEHNTCTSIRTLRRLGLTKKHARAACALLREIGLINRHDAVYWTLNWCQRLAAGAQLLQRSWNAGSVHFGVEYHYARVLYPCKDNVAERDRVIHAHFPPKPCHRRLYHGTTLYSVEKILQDGIILCSERWQTDFGRGFYCFEDPMPACAWALCKSTDHAAVIVLDVPTTEEDDKSTLLFDHTSKDDMESWKKLVIACRQCSGNVRDPDDRMSRLLSRYVQRLHHGLRWIEGPVSSGVDPVPSNDKQVVAIQESYVVGMSQFITGMLVVDHNTAGKIASSQFLKTKPSELLSTTMQPT